MQWFFDIVRALIVSWGYLTDTEWSAKYIGGRLLVRRTGTPQLVPSGEWHLVEFNSVLFDTKSEWDAPDYEFHPAAPGYYHIDFSIGFRPEFPIGKRVMASLDLNDVSKSKGILHSSNINYNQAGNNIILELTPTDVITVKVYHDAGTTENLDYNQEITFLSIHQLV